MVKGPVYNFRPLTSNRWTSYIARCQWFGYEFYDEVNPPPAKQTIQVLLHELVYVLELLLSKAVSWVKSINCCANHAHFADPVR